MWRSFMGCARSHSHRWPIPTHHAKGALNVPEQQESDAPGARHMIWMNRNCEDGRVLGSADGETPYALHKIETRWTFTARNEIGCRRSTKRKWQGRSAKEIPVDQTFKGENGTMHTAYLSYFSHVSCTLQRIMMENVFEYLGVGEEVVFTAFCWFSRQP